MLWGTPWGMDAMGDVYLLVFRVATNLVLLCYSVCLAQQTHNVTPCFLLLQ